MRNVSYNGWLCSSSTSLCVVIQNDVLSPTHPHSPSDLLMVHAVCDTHTVSIADWWWSCWLWLCGMTCVKADPTTWTWKLSQKLWAYTRVYTVLPLKCSAKVGCTVKSKQYYDQLLYSTIWRFNMESSWDIHSVSQHIVIQRIIIQQCYTLLPDWNDSTLCLIFFIGNTILTNDLFIARRVSSLPSA